jgi:hypothetical protein
VENVKVANRAVELLPLLDKYIQAVRRKDIPDPDTASFAIVVTWHKDPLAKAKLGFFTFVAKQLEGFLRQYQTDSPLIVFLAEDLEILLRSMMARIVKPDVLKGANTPLKLLKVDVNVENNLMSHDHYSSVDIGFVAESEIRAKKDKLSTLAKLSFRKDCLNCIKALVLKIQEKSPLGYTLVRKLCSLNPKLMVSKPESASRNFRILLEKMVDAGRLQLQVCDTIMDQFHSLLNKPSFKENFSREHDKSGCFLKPVL